MINLRLAMRLFMRDWRSGELRILIAALMIAIAGMTAIAVVVDRVERGMTREANQILGADRVIASPRPVSEETLRTAENFGLTRSNGLRFNTMAVAGERFQLASVRAVDDLYPLAGQLRIAKEPYAPGEIVTGAPNSGETWLSPRLLHTLDVQPGDSIEIGLKSFTVTGVIDVEPGTTDFIEFSPNLMIALSDVEATGIIQPGSRLSYRYSFAGSEAALKAFDAWTETALSESERALGTPDGAPAVESALGRARNYLNLSGLLGLLLGGVAIAIAANRFTRRHFDHAALLRCLGLKQNQVLWIYCLLLGFAAAAGTFIGVVAGYIAQYGIVEMVRDMMPEQIPAPGWRAAWLGWFTGLIVVAGFALPGLMRIRAVTPMRVLRRDLSPLPAGAWLVMSASLIALGLAMWWYTLDLTLVLVVLAGSVALTGLLLGFAQLLLNLAQHLAQRASIAVRFGLGHLLRHREATLTQIIAFGTILTLMLTILLVRGELIADWQKQLPADAPNHFIVNLPPADTDTFAAFLDKHNIAATEMYPMVRGRITQINGKPVAEVLGENFEQLHNSVRRELNLTWADVFPADNRLMDGEWNMQAGANNISIEEEMAEALNFKIGDTLTFNIGGLLTTGTINSIRKVQWDSFRPNFYVIFTPGMLDGFGATYITSFYLASERKLLLNDLLKQFPTVSVLELDRMLEQVRNVFDQASVAVEFVLLFVLAAGLAVLLATTYATLDEKIYEAGLLRTLGAAGRFIRRCTLTEYWLLGLLAGVMAAIAAEGIAFALYRFVFKIDFVFHFWLWWLSPLLGILLVAPAGMWATRHLAHTSPQAILQQNLN